MNLWRTIGGVLCFGAAAWLTFHCVVMFQPVTLPALRQLGHETNLFYMIHVGPLTLTGWQIPVFEAMLALFAVAFVFLGIYAFDSKSNEG